MINRSNLKKEDLMKNFNLTGKVTVITGATKGIELGIAKTFAKNSAELALIRRNVKSGEKALLEIRNISKKKSMFYSCDVGKYIQVKKTCDQILSDFNKVDILACSAGWTVKAPLENMDIKIWNKAIAVNLNVAFYFIRNLINSMLNNKYGNIIILGSSVIWNGAGISQYYPATKVALPCIVKGLSYEYLPRGIRANIISPALIDTPMLRERSRR